MVDSLAFRYQEISGTVKQACLIAVSKMQPVEALAELYHLGHRDFGENYAQELIEKAAALTARGLKGIRWHFIGHLQTNKVKSIIPWVSAVHSVDSLKLALELSKRWSPLNKPNPLSIFIEVNIAGEEAKAGIAPGEARTLCEQIARECPALRLEGLMCIPPASGDPRSAFIQLRELEAECRPFTRSGLSMGMSSDFPVALEEGATHVRVGTRLFGVRPSA